MRHALPVLILLLAGCAAPSWDLDGRDSVEIGDLSAFGPRHASLAGHNFAIGQALEGLGVTSGGVYAGSPLTTGDIDEVLGIGASSSKAATLTGANIFGANGVTTTFPGTTSASFLNGNLNAKGILLNGGANGIWSATAIQLQSDTELSWSATTNAAGTQDLFRGRISPGVSYLGATTGTPDGTLQLKTRTFVDPAGASTVTFTTATEILDVSTDEVTTGLIPANAYDVHVVTRNTSTIVGTTATSYDVGIEGVDLDAFGQLIAFTDTTSTDMSDWSVTSPLAFSSSAREVRLTPKASGTLDTGTVQVVAFYRLLVAQSED